MQKTVEIYTDGAASGNPGPGGYGVVMLYGKHRKEMSKGFRLTTNNRMELMSVIDAITTLKERCHVTVYSDSKYVVDAVEKRWVFKWERTNFKDKKNVDLWKRFLKVFPKHNISFIWVKGHAGNALNERCDELAVKASKGQALLTDSAYEMSQKSEK